MDASFQRRISTGGSSATSSVSATAPQWVKLVREGDVFTGYSSEDGTSWVAINNVTITMTSNVYIGLAVTSHNDGSLCTAQFNNVTVGSGEVPPPDLGGCESTEVNQKQNNATWMLLGTYNLLAGTGNTLKISNAGTSGYVIADGVKFVKSGQADIIMDSENGTGITVEGTWSASSSVSGYLGSNYRHDGNTGKGSKSVTYTPSIPVDGAYDVYMIWTSASNRASNVPVEVCYAGLPPQNELPVVALTSPANGAAFIQGENIAIQATASDADGTISLVEFYQGTTKVGEDNTSPYSYSWSGASIGAYTLYAKATDDKGGSTTSAGIGINVVEGQGPYGGSAWEIPGRVEAENYDTGGEGVAFHDTDDGNNDCGGRAENVDVQATSDVGGGCNVGWIYSGEWLEYSVNVTASGVYDITFRVASASAGGAVHLELDGADITGTLTFPATGNWQTWSNMVASNVSLTAGEAIMRLAMDANSFNINYIDFTLVGAENEAPTVNIASPANNQQFLTGDNIAIAADASDSDGTVSLVEFYQGSTKLGQDNSSPYNYTWNNVPKGSYQLTAVATDNDGGMATSSIINVQVKDEAGDCGSPSGGPTDNPIASAYPGEYSWAANLAWECVYNVNDYSGSAAQKFSAAQNDAVANGGGVVYFPAGTYTFTDDLLVKSGVVIRGATPSNTDAKSSSFNPATNFEFPQYVFTESGSGTSNSTAFKFIKLEDPNNSGNVGIVYVDINRAGIDFAATDKVNVTGENMVFYGIRTNNVGKPTPGVPDEAKGQKAYQRHSYRFTYNIIAYNAKTLL
ncbi:MAG: carbohydrate-binding protein [Bacteroidales bacterium]|nr:carbohydrate-binding protein [Bacteroidales bacterium]